MHAMETYRRQFELAGAGAASALALTGIWTQHVWVFWLNTAAMGAGSLPWQSMYLVTGLAMLVAAGLVLLGRPSAGRLRAVDVVAGAVSTAATLVVALAVAGLAAPSAATAAKIVAVAGYGWAYLRWGQFYGRLSIRQAVAYLFTASIAAAALKLVVFALPPLVAGIFAALLPALSIMLCRRALRLTAEGDEGDGAPAPGKRDARPSAAEAASGVLTAAPRFTRDNVGALWKVAAVFVVFSLANASMLSFQPTSDTLGGVGLFAAARALDALLCLGILLFVFALARPFDFPQLWKIVLFVLATDLLCELIAPDAGMQALFSGVSLNFIVLFLWLTLADVARHSTFSPFPVFGIGWSCYVLPFYGGSLLAAAFFQRGLGASYVAVLLYVVALTMALCLQSRDQNIAHIFGDLAERERVAPSDFDDIESRCAAVGARAGLTAREVEVMQLFCKGRTKAYIAETMYVTENTVRSHIKHIYTKLGVHSRKEIQELIDAY